MERNIPISAEDLRGCRLNREILERHDRDLVHERYPQLVPAQLDEVKRRVDAMVHETAGATGVPDDVAFVMLAGRGRLDEAGYLAQAESLSNAARRSAEPHGEAAASAPPQFSPDGQWWWNGQRWLPAREAPKEARRPAPHKG